MTPARSRTVRAGAGLAGLYVLVAVATAGLSHRPLLPLFDGFVPPTPYAWVKPPPERAGDNVAPKSAERQFPLGADGVAASNASTDDAQAIVGLDKGSVPANPPDSGVTVKIQPVDSGTLGLLPPGLRPISNAYHVTIVYTPSQKPLTTLPVKGTIALTAAEGGDRMLYSADGRTWQEEPFKPYGQDNGVFADLNTTGWFLVATTAKATAVASSSHTARTVLIIAGVVVVSLAGVVVLWARSRARTGTARRSGGRPASRTKPTVKKPPPKRPGKRRT